MDMEVVIPLLIEKIKEWKRRRKAAIEIARMVRWYRVPSSALVPSTE